MRGYYYLHTNGSLIFKPEIVIDSDPEYFNSPFVKKHWHFDTENRSDAWRIVIEALALGARKERISELKKKWNLTDEDGRVFAEVTKLRLFKDGDQFCATFQDYVNIQESRAGFGETALEAFADLAKGGLNS